MIDLHCHFLPGIDDGPRQLEESLALATLAVEEGISHAVMTPHVNPGTFNNDTRTIRPVFASFQQALHDARIPLTVAMAGEVRISAELLVLLPSGRIPMLGSYQGDQIMLLELPHSHVPPGTDKLIRWLASRNIRPLIAHPERNRDIQSEPAYLRQLVDLGCLFQLTADSVTGDFGERPWQRAKQILRQGWATVIASDAHNVKRRPPRLISARQVAESYLGESAAWDLVLTHPQQITASLFVDQEPSTLVPAL